MHLSIVGSILRVGAVGGVGGAQVAVAEAVDTIEQREVTAEEADAGVGGVHLVLEGLGDVAEL